MIVAIDRINVWHEARRQHVLVEAELDRFLIADQPRPRRLISLSRHWDDIIMDGETHRMLLYNGTDDDRAALREWLIWMEFYYWDEEQDAAVVDEEDDENLVDPIATGEGFDTAVANARANGRLQCAATTLPRCFV